MNDGIAAIDNDYVCFVNAANTYLYNLTIDGVAIPADAYKLLATKNGITKLVINKNYLVLLSKGVHEVRISVQGSEIPTVFEITLM